MSKLYRIRIREKVKRVITARDSVSYPVRLTEILPREEMKDLLRDSLRDQEWVESAADVFEKNGPTGEELVFDVGEMEVRASIDESREESVREEKEAVVDADRRSEVREAKKVLSNELREKVKANLDQLEVEAQKDVSYRLGGCRTGSSEIYTDARLNSHI